MSKYRRPALIVLGFFVLVVLGVLGFHWWSDARFHVSTDNAYVRGHIVQLTPRVNGTVEKVLVEDNQYVKEGQLLVQLDRRDFELAAKQAEANLAIIKAKLKAGELGVPLVAGQTSARINEAMARVARMEKNLNEANSELSRSSEQEKSAKASLDKAMLDKVRSHGLLASGIISQDRFDEDMKNLEIAEANYQAAGQAVKALQSRVHSLQDQIKETQAQLSMAQTGKTSALIQDKEVIALQAQVALAEANLQKAMLDLTYTDIMASVAGFISKKSVEMGQRIQPGQPLMAIVPIDNIWIEANFKETQLTNVKVGQPVRISADIYPGYEYKGRVDSIGAGTGAVFSLLPPENATGNWIKIVQRLPIKIVLDNPIPKEKPLRLGLSTEVTIDTADSNHQPHPLAQTILK